LPAVVTADIYLGYTLGGRGLISGTEFSVNVQNLFDAQPPIGPGGPRTDVDVVGRIVWLGIRKKW
jgi:outer membrane receptor protein involved in Fe transport